MPSETAKKMKGEYEKILALTEKFYELSPEIETRMKAELEIKTGLSPAKVQRMIDNMVLTGRFVRVQGEAPATPEEKVSA